MAGGDAERDPAAGPALSGPAPIIDLGEDAVPVRPAPTLGPRRLARLRRELAERAREVEEAGGSPADPAVAEQQRRFAELAAQVQAADPSTGAVGVQAAAPSTGGDPHGAGPAAAGVPVPPEPVGTPRMEPEPAERITVVFPDAAAAGPDDFTASDPAHVDPALFGDRPAPGNRGATTHIEVVAPGGREPAGSHTAPEAPAPASGVDAPVPASGERVVPGDDAVLPTGVEEPVPSAVPGDDAVLPAAAEEPVPPAVRGDAAVFPPAAEEDPVPPAAPVPATAAEGLELLEPRQYRRRTVGPGLVLLLLALLAAVVVVAVFLVP